MNIEHETTDGTAVEETAVEETPTLADVLKSTTDNEALVALAVRYHDAGDRDGARLVETRLRQLAEARESAEDPADPKSSDRAQLVRWIDRERTKLEPDAELLGALVQRARELDAAERAADPVDLATGDLAKIAAWRARELAAFEPDADLVAALEDAGRRAHQAAVAARPPVDTPGLAARVAALEARLEALAGATGVSGG